MLSTQQLEFCSNIVTQYDYYAVYYRYDYTDYTYMERDYLIEIVCSDTLPIVENGRYTFTDAVYYRVIDNKYYQSTLHDSYTLVPMGSTDIVYSNAVEGLPQLCYIESSVRTFDYGYYLTLFVLLFFSGALILRILFGGKN